MQITHFCNSCINISSGDTSLLCDPWIGPADENAWLSFPFMDEAEDIIQQLKPDYVYISHLHPDHHDVHTLEHVARDTAILIKKFPDGRLYKKLVKQGFTKIIQLEAWERFSVGSDLEIAIVPSTSMVKDEIDAAIQYDIDTSILIKCKNTDQLFYNNVDNPTSLTALNEVRSFAEKTWSKPPDVACLPVGAASEYPHCFLNIDRKAAAGTVIEAALTELPDRIAALGCNQLFLAGGTYVIRGKYASLSQYVAQPSFDAVRERLKNWTEDGNALLALEGGYGIRWDFEDSGWKAFDTGFEKKADKEAYTVAASSMPYDYSDVTGRVEEYLSRFHAAFPGAKNNYDRVMERIGLVQEWTTEFNLYEKLELTADGKIADGQVAVEKITLPPMGDASLQTLVLHMDLGLAVDLLEDTRNWNGAISGTYILYERTPDVFLPDIPFSLNFLINRNHPPKMVSSP